MTAIEMLEVSWNGEKVQNVKQSLDSNWKTNSLLDPSSAYKSENSP